MPKGTTTVQGIPTGKLNDLNNRVSKIETTGTAIYVETPTGLINGSNKIYTTVNTITTVINFSINGAFIHPVDYSTTGTTITFVTALDVSLSGLPFTIVYK